MSCQTSSSAGANHPGGWHARAVSTRTARMAAADGLGQAGARRALPAGRPEGWQARGPAAGGSPGGTLGARGYSGLTNGPMARRGPLRR